MNQYTERFFAQFANQWVEVSRDARRTIEEVNTQEFCVQRYTVHAQIGLGNHFHQVVESFYFATGTGVIYLVPVVNGELDLANRSKVEVGPGSTLEVPPDMVHLFMMERGALFFCHSHGSFEAKWSTTTTLAITPW